MMARLDAWNGGMELLGSPGNIRCRADSLTSCAQKNPHLRRTTIKSEVMELWPGSLVVRA